MEYANINTSQFFLIFLLFFSSFAKNFHLFLLLFVCIFCPFCVFDSRSFYLQQTGVCVYVFDSAKLIYRFYCYFCIILCSRAFAPSASSFQPNNRLVCVRANVQCYFGLLSFIVIAFWCFIWLFIIWNGWRICVYVLIDFSSSVF